MAPYIRQSLPHLGPGGKRTARVVAWAVTRAKRSYKAILISPTALGFSRARFYFNTQSQHLPAQRLRDRCRLIESSGNPLKEDYH